MNDTKPTLVEEQIKALKEAGAPVSIGTVVAHKPGVKGPNRHILEKWLPTWVRNSYENFKFMGPRPHGLPFLRGSARGLPAVVVGIGPSLDQNIDKLRSFQKNAIIISTDAAFRPLWVRGILPHVVVNIDAGPNQHLLFTHVPTERTALLASTATDPATLRAWKGALLAFNMAHPGIEFMDLVLPSAFPTAGSLYVHGTVGNTAVLLAATMGCSRVLTVGMDLCYGALPPNAGPVGWKYRCQDYVPRPGEGWEAAELKVIYDNEARVRDAFEVELKGRKFMVDPELDMYRNSLLELAGALTETEVVDCSVDGVLPAVGFRHQKFEDALLEHCGREIQPGESVALHLREILQGRE